MYWNAKCSDRHTDPDYYTRYNHNTPNAKERVRYAMENSVVIIGNHLTPSAERDLNEQITERINEIFND